MSLNFNPSLMLLIPAFILAIWAQNNIKSTFEKYSRIKSHKGMTGAEVARMLLDRAGLCNVIVNSIPGLLTDHYDPTKRTVNLSKPVYESLSIASLGVAAHECGHAIQHNYNYYPIVLRNKIVPIANLSSTFAIPLFFLGLLLSATGLMTLGVVLFTGVMFFHLITLPVEFDASSRALSILAESRTLYPNELVSARAVLRAAAWTYIAAVVMAAVQLLRLVMLRNRS